MKSILDPSFEYTPNNETDIRQTFARAWRELGEREACLHRIRPLPTSARD